MILIFSENQETTTNEVIKWLIAFNKKFIRINEDEIFEIKVNAKKIYLESKTHKFFLDEIASIWFRRGGLKIRRLQYDNESINLHMEEHQDCLEDYVIKILEAKIHINKISNNYLNKIYALEQAKKIGLEIPEFFLATNTTEVILNKTITKPMTQNITFDSITANSDGIIYTTVIDKIEKNDFHITFFQEKIEKDFEIRSFYLNDKIWSTAIISQNDEKTKIDFRKYNTINPNRNVRYNLPAEIEKKLQQLMNSLDLNCGSIDFIKRGNKFYFLEINPVGQFLGISNICNYSLEKEIAECL